MGDATVNGDMPHSATLSHITSYPVVSDTISAFAKNSYGAKSIDLTNASYAKFVKPTLPYFQTPASYVSPYVAKADQIGDNVLSKFDEQVPMVKQETSEIKSTVMDYASWPYNQATAGKDYLKNKYITEYKKCGGDGIVAGGKAVITSSLVISSDVLTWISDFLAAKKGEAMDAAEEAKKAVKAKADEAKEKSSK